MRDLLLCLAYNALFAGGMLLTVVAYGVALVAAEAVGVSRDGVPVVAGIVPVAAAVVFIRYFLRRVHWDPDGGGGD